MAGGDDNLRRLRWSLSRADTSSNQWLDMQENISRSIQLLIRESIQRDGYIDVVNRPVEQLPRRGRPPASDATGQTDRQSDRSSQDEPQDRSDEREAGPSVDPSSHGAGEQEDQRAAAEPVERVEPDKPVEAPEPAEPAEQSSHPTNQAAASGQQDMDDIFGHG